MISMRTAIIVHYENDSFISNLDDRIFSIAYNSKRYKYVYLYLNKTNKDRALNILKDNEYILNIEDSLLGVEEIIL